MDERVCRAVAKVRGRKSGSSATPNSLPLFWTEWNVQGMKESRDTPFVGPALANTVRQCDGSSEMMSFWTFSDVFEEGGPIPKTVHRAVRTLRAKGGINKPSYYAWGIDASAGRQADGQCTPRMRSSDQDRGRRPCGPCVGTWWIPDQHGGARLACASIFLTARPVRMSASSASMTNTEASCRTMKPWAARSIRLPRRWSSWAIAKQHFAPRCRRRPEAS